MSTAALSIGGPARAWLARLSLASVAPIVEFSGRFARMLLLSRLLSSIEFGTSVALLVVVGTAQTISDIGLDRFVMLRSDLEGRQALAAAHLICIVRGIVLAVGLVLIAPFAAQSFGVPEARSSFAWAALYPLIHGFSHLGTKRAYRHYDFRREAMATVSATLIALTSAVLAGLALHQHNAILVSIIAGEATYVVVTHLLSVERYEVALHRSMIREALSFGLPLTLNGVGLAIFAQADRLIVGTVFGVKVLGAYALVVSLAIMAISPLSAICSSLSVSIIAKSRAQLQRFPAVFDTISAVYGLFGLTYCVLVGLGLDLVVPFIYGPQYTVSPGVRIALATIALLRILRGPATSLFLVDGDTRQLSCANLLSGCGLVLALWFVTLHPTIEAMLVGILIGDCVSLAAFQLLVCRKLPTVLNGLARRLVAELGFAVASGLALAATASAGLHVRLLLGILCVLVLGWMAHRAFQAAERTGMVRA